MCFTGHGSSACLTRKRQSRLSGCPLPAGSGKTTLVSSWLDSRSIPPSGISVDDGDADLATFFYYLGRAGRKAAPRQRAQLPLLTRNTLPGPRCSPGVFLSNSAAGFCREASRAMVSLRMHWFFDNVHDIPADAPFYDMLAAGFESLSAASRPLS